MQIKATKLEVRRRSKGKYTAAELREYYSYSRLYFWFKGESILDHLANRRNEPWREVKKILPAALEEAGVAFSKLSFSQKCGCSCGCSPGFYVLDGEAPGGLGQFDIFVDLELVD
jgi:hypothetical protein